jgi:hypothetical protein
MNAKPIQVSTGSPHPLSSTRPIEQSVLHWREVLITAGAIGAVCLSLAVTAQPPMHDQWYLLLQSGRQFWHPLESGISSRYLAGLVSLVTSDLTVHNTIVRSLSAALSIGALSAALVAAGAPFRLWLISMVAFVTSGAPWLWVSPDVIAAAGIALLGWATFQSAPTGRYVFAAWLLMFAKPDLLLPGLALAILWRPSAWPWLLLVAVLTASSDQITQEQTGRATLSFWQHFEAIKYGAMGDFNEWTMRRDAEFGKDATVWAIIRTFPAQYGWFVVWSVWRSLSCLVATGLIGLVPACGWITWRWRSDRVSRGAVAFVALNAVIVTALAFAHTRYYVRFLVLALLLLAWAHDQSPPWAQRLMMGSLIGLTAYQLIWLPQVIADGLMMWD